MTHPNTRIQRVVGVDLSLTSCGVAVITQRASGDCIATVATYTSRGKRLLTRVRNKHASDGLSAVTWPELQPTPTN